MGYFQAFFLILVFYIRRLSFTGKEYILVGTLAPIPLDFSNEYPFTYQGEIVNMLNVHIYIVRKH